MFDSGKCSLKQCSFLFIHVFAQKPAFLKGSCQLFYGPGWLTWYQCYLKMHLGGEGLGASLWVLRHFLPLISSLLIGKQDFPHSSVGKESACDAGDPGLIPGSGRSPGEGKGYPLQYSWAALVAQLVKNLPATEATWVRSLGRQDSLEKGKATHSSILAWRIPWTKSMGVAKSLT